VGERKPPLLESGPVAIKNPYKPLPTKPYQPSKKKKNEPFFFFPSPPLNGSQFPTPPTLPVSWSLESPFFAPSLATLRVVLRFLPPLFPAGGLKKKSAPWWGPPPPGETLFFWGGGPPFSQGCPFLSSSPSLLFSRKEVPRRHPARFGVLQETHLCCSVPNPPAVFRRFAPPCSFLSPARPPPERPLAGDPKGPFFGHPIHWVFLVKERGF